MSPELQLALCKAGAVAAMTFAAMGSALGTGAAGCAAVGAWKRCFLQKRPAPFQLIIFVGAPLSQTIYGMLIMLLINGMAKNNLSNWPLYLIGGVTAGIAMGISAWFQGKTGAGAADSFADTQQGLPNDLIALGLIETVAIFVLAFFIILLIM